MDTIIKHMKKNVIVQSALYVLLGLFLILWPKTIVTTVVYLVAAFVCVHGALDLFSYFRSRKSVEYASNSLIGGIFFLFLGILMFIFPKQVAGMISILLGLIIILSSIMNMLRAMDFKKTGGTGWLLPLLISVVIMLAGILIIINPFSTPAVLTIFSGILLIVTGVSDLIALSIFSSAYKNLKNQEKNSNLR